MMLSMIAGIEDWAVFIGHFHPVFVHLPIGMLLLVALVYFFKKGSDPRGLSFFFFWTFVTAVISCIMGYGLSLSGGYEEETLVLHQYLGLSVAVLSGILAYTTAYWTSDPVMKKSFQPLFYTGLVAITITGHLGGNLTHGADYLWKELPSPLREWLGMPSKSSDASSGVVVYHIKDMNQALVYQDLVQPVLKQKCWSCHNESKQKGDLRMDSPQFLLTGGEHGASISAGKPDKSILLQRVLLDENHEDHMPPKGKIALTADEIAVLQWWIQGGADFKSRVLQLPKEEKIKQILSKLMAGNTSESSSEDRLSPVYQLDVSAVSESDLADLRAMNLLVTPVSKTSNLVELNAVNAPGLGDKELEKLSPISEQLVALKLGKTKISDASATTIQNCSHLVRLQVEHTKIGDAAIKKWIELAHLEVINLVGTQITDACISDLAKFKSLKKVYVWQSKMSDKGLLALQKLRPDLQVISGTKVQWPLKSDTIKVIQAPIK